MLRRTILVFLATALAGLAARQLFESYAVIAAVFGSENFMAIQTVLNYLSFPTLAVAAVAGYLLSPRRFWLWAVASVCLMPLESALQTYRTARAGFIDSSDYFGIALINTTILLVLLVLCVACAGIGAGLRLLVGRISRRS